MLTGRSTGSQTVPPEWCRWAACVGELHEVAEVLDRPVAAPVVEVADERRAVGGREDRVAAADLDVVGRVARDLRERRRRRRLDDAAAQAAREAHALAVDVGAGVREQRAAPRACRGTRSRPARGSCRRSASISSRPSSESTSNGRQRPREERDACDGGVQPRGLPSGTAAAAPAGRRLGHVGLLSWVAPVRRRRCRVAALRRGRDAPRRQLRRRREARRTGRCRAGSPSRATKCSWKRGSTAVSIFSTRRTTSSISARAVRSSSAMRAPVPAALPAEVTRSGSQSGTSPSTSACTGSMWAPKAPARRIRSTRSSPYCSISRRQPACSAALASWIWRTSFCVIVSRGSPS